MLVNGFINAYNTLRLVWANLRIGVDFSAKLDSMKQTFVEFPLCAELGLVALSFFKDEINLPSRGLYCSGSGRYKHFILKTKIAYN